MAAQGVHRERGPGQKAEEVATEPQLPELSSFPPSVRHQLTHCPWKRAWSASLVCAGHPGTRSPLLKPWVPHRRAGRRHGWACLGRPILCRRVDAFIRTAAVAVFWTHWAPGVSGLTFRGHTVHSSGECQEVSPRELTIFSSLKQQKGPRSDNSKSNKIFVGGIPHNCGETELREYFKKFGVVSSPRASSRSVRAGVAQPCVLGRLSLAQSRPKPHPFPAWPVTIPGEDLL